MAFNSVDLPAPFVPMSPMTSPASAWKSTVSTATIPPKRTVGAAAETGDEPGETERHELGARGGDRQRGRAGLVLADADDHPADAGAPQVADEQQHRDEHREHEVVVRAVVVREVDRAELAAREL